MKRLHEVLPAELPGGIVRREGTTYDWDDLANAIAHSDREFYSVAAYDLAFQRAGAFDSLAVFGPCDYDVDTEKPDGKYLDHVENSIDAAGLNPRATQLIYAVVDYGENSCVYIMVVAGGLSLSEARSAAPLRGDRSFLFAGAETDGVVRIFAQEGDEALGPFDATRWEIDIRTLLRVTEENMWLVLPRSTLLGGEGLLLDARIASARASEALHMARRNARRVLAGEETELWGL